MHRNALFTYAKTLHPRDLLQKMTLFTKSTNLRVGVLFGLRRTGKSVLLRQWLLHLPLEEQKKAAYISIEQESMADIIHDLNTLRCHGCTDIVIDEITACEDFTTITQAGE